MGRDQPWNCKSLLYVIAKMIQIFLELQNLVGICSGIAKSYLSVYLKIIRRRAHPKGYAVLTTKVAAVPKKERNSAGDGLRKLTKTATQLYTN
jgi:hypothetical protein